MATIFNNIDRVAGDPLQSVLVSIVLVWDKSVSTVASIQDEDTMIRSSYGTKTDSDGRWETNLVSNDEITPANSLYKITERINDDSIAYYVSVPNSATPTFWVGDILVDPDDLPDWV
jgi:hypothetical protein